MRGRVLAIAAGAAAAFAGVIVIVTGALCEFHRFDDEGYILISLRGFITGHPLFTETYSQYGPAFYALVGGFFRVTHLAIGPDPARVLTALLGLATSALIAATAWQLCASAAAAVLAFAMSIVTNVAGVEGALHPTHLATFLVALLAYVATRPSETKRSSFWSGVLLATLVLIKVNIGCLALAAYGSTFVLGPKRRSQLLRVGIVVGTPFALEVLALKDGQSSVLLHSAVLASILLAVASRGVSDGDSRPFGREAIGGFVVASALWSGVSLLTGTGLGDLVRGVLIDPLKQPHALSVPADAPGYKSAVLLLAVLAAASYVFTARGRAQLERHPVGAAAFRMGAAAAAGIGVVTLMRSRTGLPGFDGALVGICVAWVPLIRPTASTTLQRGRYLICTLAVLMPLQAYPVYGGQRLGGNVFLGLVCVLCASDGLDDLRRTRIDGRATQIAKQCLMGGFAASLLAVGISNSVDLKTDAVPLNLPGAHIARVPSKDAVAIRAVVKRLDSCETYFGLPGLNSFYILGQDDPPTWLNAGHWMTLFDRTKQAKVVADLSHHRQFCVIRNRKAETFWLERGEAVAGPLRPYLLRKPISVEHFGDYEIDVVTNPVPQAAADKR